MEVNTVNRLKLTTYNCKHFKDRGPKLEFMQQVMSDCDILLLQEDCLFEEQLVKLKAIHDNVEVTGKSSMDSSVQLQGRPYGGCAIVYKTDIISNVKIIDCDNKRLCGILMNIGENVIIVLNTYMPCDNNSYDSNYMMYTEVLHEVTRIMHRFNNATHVLFGGDMNTDMNRNSTHTKYLKQFCRDNEMSSCCLDTSIPYTFIGPRSTSKIDHFIVNNDVLTDVINCQIIDDHCFSDHVPVKLSLNVAYNCNILQEREHVARLKWDCAKPEDIDMYKDQLATNLNDIVCNQELLSCTDIHCIKHKDELCAFYGSILQSCIDAGEACIPSNSKNHVNTYVKCIPGWKDHVEEFHKESLWWHRYW